MPKEINVNSPCGVFKFLRPQLAKTAKEKLIKKVEGNDRYIAEMKLDGHRCLLGSNVAWSRIGKDIGCLSHAQAELPKGYLLDGEIIPREGAEGSDRVSNLRAESPESLVFSAFDILYFDGKYVGDRAWSERRNLLISVVRDDMKNITLSEIYQMSENSTADLMQIALERGHEGIMIKDVQAPYKANSRSSWAKLKFTDNYDVVIVDCEAKPSEWRVRPGEVYRQDGKLYPEGLHTDPWTKGYVGLNYGFYDKEGNLRVVGSLGETGPRDEMEKFVGRVAEIKGYGQYPTGAIRHPVLERWRDDKLPEDCVFNF